MIKNKLIIFLYLSDINAQCKSDEKIVLIEELPCEKNYSKFRG